MYEYEYVQQTKKQLHHSAERVYSMRRNASARSADHLGDEFRTNLLSFDTYVADYVDAGPSEVAVAYACSKWFWEGVCAKRALHGWTWPLYTMLSFCPLCVRRRGAVCGCAVAGVALLTSCVILVLLSRSTWLDRDAWRSWKAVEIDLLRDATYEAIKDDNPT